MIQQPRQEYPFFAPANGSLSLIAEAIAKTLLPPKTQVFGACLKQDKIGPRGSGIARIGINVSTEQTKGLDVIPAQEIDRRLILGLLP